MTDHDPAPGPNRTSLVVAFLTAGVTSTVIHRADAKAPEDDRARTDRHTRTIVAALTDTRTAIADLDSRLDHILLGGWAYGAISRDSDERRRALAARLGSRAPPAGRPRLGTVSRRP